MKSVAAGSSNIGNESGSDQITENLPPNTIFPIDNFVNTQSRQVTLKSKMVKKNKEKKFVSELVVSSSQIRSGEENVVQIITNNGPNFVNAGKRLMETRSHVYWTPCAAHCIDLLLEDIE
uniref:DUF659 domain-containing protein n=1 Tax=Solanum lycopersicum TaxID=4081 RepID=A0A3Q7IW22_SOLLC